MGEKAQNLVKVVMHEINVQTFFFNEQISRLKRCFILFGKESKKFIRFELFFKRSFFYYIITENCSFEVAFQNVNMFLCTSSK